MLLNMLFIGLPLKNKKMYSKIKKALINQRYNYIVQKAYRAKFLKRNVERAKLIIILYHTSKFTVTQIYYYI